MKEWTPPPRGLRAIRLRVVICKATSPPLTVKRDRRHLSESQQEKSNQSAVLAIGVKATPPSWRLKSPLSALSPPGHVPAAPDMYLPPDIPARPLPHLSTFSSSSPLSSYRILPPYLLALCMCLPDSYTTVKALSDHTPSAEPPHEFGLPTHCPSLLCSLLGPLPRMS